MAPKKSTGDYKTDKPTILNNSNLLTDLELAMLKEDFYRAARFLNLQNAEDFLR